MRIRYYWLRLCLSLLALPLLHPDGARAQKAPAGQEKRIPLQQAIKLIEEKFHMRFAYEHNLLKDKFTTEKALEGATAEEVLKNVLYPNNLLFLYVSSNSYSIVARDASFFQNNEAAGTTPAIPQPASHTLRGIVTDEKGAPIPFASIWVKGTRRGTQSSDRGEFALANLLPGDSLVVSFVGYANKMIAPGDQTFLTVSLSPLPGALLGEATVVSNGLQQLPKERTTGAFGTITAKQLEKLPSPNVVQRIEGQVPGVRVSVLSGDRSFIYSSGNQLGINSGTHTVGNNDYGVAVRGVGTLQGETFPLVVLDGAITDLDISAVNPDDIENITFLKDAAAASIWGVRAANGVIVITTKRGHMAPAPAISFTANASIADRPPLGYLRRMNSAQQTGYEAELVRRGFLTSTNIDGSSYSTASYYPNPGAVLALRLKAGSITQSAYNASIDSLNAIDNTGQIQHYLLQPATTQEYGLSVSGGNNNSNYYYSASYSREDPNARKTVGQRLTVTLNNSWKLFRIATLSTSIKGAFFTYTNDGMGINSLFPGNSPNVLMPYMQLADANGHGVSYDRINPAFTNTLSTKAFVNWKYNYLDELNNNDDVQRDNNYIATVKLDVPLYKGLSGSVQYSNERTFSNHRVWYNPQSYYYRNTVNYYTSPTATTGNGLGIASGGILSLVSTNVNNYALRGQLAYDRTLARIHQINAIAGIEARQTQMGQSTGTLYGYNTSTGLNIPVSYLSSAYTSIYGYSTSIGGAPSQSDKRRRFLSYYSNAAYTLLDRYSLSGSVRYDDYNNFGLNQKFRATPLWSAGAKWNLAKENFMKSLPRISTLALRTTYGVNGNISTAVYPYTAISLGSNDFATGLATASITSLANPQLKWEKTYVTNLGLDFGFFDNRFGGAIDVYKKVGKDLLYTFPINAALSGTINNGTLTRNAASMTGKGVDLSLYATVINSKDWSWNIGMNLSYNVNKITENRFDTSSITSNSISYTPAYISYVKGYATDKLLVFRNAGLNPSGLTTVYNRKNDTVSATSPIYFADLKNAGHTTAPYFGGWNTTVRYKQFSLYALLTYQFGGVFLKPSINNYITAYYNLSYSISGDIAKRWEQSGDESRTKIPGLGGTATQVAYSLYRYQYSDINVLKSDYIRLREISLSYELPMGWLRKMQAKGASAGFAVRNLGLLWKANNQGYDPDFVGYANGSYSLPASRSYNFSLKLNY